MTIREIVSKLPDRVKKPLRKVMMALGYKAPSLGRFDSIDPADLPADQLLAIMRNDAHRIEKSFYNRIFVDKIDAYAQYRQNVLQCIDQLAGRGVSDSEPTVSWAREIAELFDRLPDEFISKKSTPSSAIDRSAQREFVDSIATRRSSRVWSAQQPDFADLLAFARGAVDAARWAPNSGNRQAVRFKFIVAPEQKRMLKGLKEEHCYNAPFLIFVGVDSRLYGAHGDDEGAPYIDAGAAAMQSVLSLHAAHLGVCWNHLTQSLIDSRPSNIKVWKSFCSAVGIPEYIEPVALIAFGIVESHPPVPARMSIDSFLLE